MVMCNCNDDQYLLSELSAFIVDTHTHPIVKNHSDYNFKNIINILFSELLWLYLSE